MSLSSLQQHTGRGSSG